MEDFVKAAQANMQQLLEDRRHIHAEAELGMNLPKTTAYVMRRLKIMGLEPREICKSGVVACIEGSKPGKTLLLRADMDALPMPEENDLPFKSTTGAAHQCGHDMHAAMLLGAAALLTAKKNEFKGAVKLMFQPGEEVFQGSAAMLEGGLLENPRVDAAMALHVSTEEPVGAIYYGSGSVSSSCDGFKITVHGKGCHGAMPDLGIDPINAAVHIYLAMQNLIARECPPTQTAVLTLGQFAGGTANNIIPETVVLQGTLRTYDKAVRKKLASRLREVADLCARTFGATADYEVLSDVPSIHANPALLEEMIGHIGQMSFPFKLHEGYRLTPSDDFARVSEKVPSIFLNISARTPDNPFPLHNPGCVLDEAVLPLGAAVHAHCAFHWLNSH